MRPIRVLMGKVGLDGHDRGAKVVMAALRDAGMEVIFSGLHQTPQAVVRAAIEEDVDVIGLSILSGAHNDLVPIVLDELKKQEASDVPVIVGGIIPQQDVEFLLKIGVGAVFTPGTRLDEIVQSIQNLVSDRMASPKVVRIQSQSRLKKKVVKKKKQKVKLKAKATKKKKKKK